MATGYGLDGSGLDSWQGKEIFLYSIAPRLTLGPTQPPIQWITGALSPEVKWLGREGDHSLPTSAGVKNGGAVPPLLHTWCLIN
jgi:hypothetical protein